MAFDRKYVLMMCERSTAEYEEELSPTKEAERQHQLLDAVFKRHQVVLHRADVQQRPHIKEEEEEPQYPHIKEEEEEVWITLDGDCLPGQEEADLAKCPLTVVSVKTENHEDRPPESSHLQHSPMRTGMRLGVLAWRPSSRSACLIVWDETCVPPSTMSCCSSSAVSPLYASNTGQQLHTASSFDHAQTSVKNISLSSKNGASG
ncbi:uncharacterized protein LOC133554374 isoform X3 [Nerophis ophidion]|uniref:uncharacterized protein LOC133554374 isoform X3 n=1 Tax=Nerophis ophidion TaxID=159077 RepID=UPI002ADF3598|nr:uncharacterized protein LOC133554374 isoform X3 [Nerophis ophidion]